MFYIFKLRDGQVTIPKKIYEQHLNIEWFLSNMIKYSCHEHNSEEPLIIEVFESKNAVMTLFDSLRFNKLVLYNESIDYIIQLADYWCAPEWLQKDLLEFKEVNKIKNKSTLLDNTDEPVKYCKICYTGFKESENTSTSCATHSGSFISTIQKFDCCGRDSSEEPCRKGYHYSND